MPELPQNNQVCVSVGDVRESVIFIELKSKDRCDFLVTTDLLTIIENS